MNKTTFYSIMQREGGPRAVLHEGYTDGTFYYYRLNGTWCAIFPKVGLCIANGSTRKECAEEAHKPENIRRITAVMEQRGTELEQRFKQLMQEAEQ